MNPQPRWLAVLGAEVRKLVGLRSMGVAVAIALVITPAIALMNSRSLHAALDSGNTAQLLSTSTIDSGFIELTLGMIAAITIGVFAMSSEYRTSRGTTTVGPQIFTSLAAVPRRPMLLGGKGLAVALIVTPLAALSTALTLWMSRFGLGSYAFPVDRALVVRGLGVVAYWVLTAELVLAATVIVRNGVVPMIVGIGNSSVISVSFLLGKLTRWAAYLPDAAGAQLFIREEQTQHHLTAFAGGLTMTIWTVAAIAIATLVFCKRDA
jgi:ABC-2 type transport system permease protein